LLEHTDYLPPFLGQERHANIIRVLSGAAKCINRGELSPGRVAACTDDSHTLGRQVPRRARVGAPERRDRFGKIVGGGIETLFSGDEVRGFGAGPRRFFESVDQASARPSRPAA
jgi:hypothetical protein